MSVAGMLGVDEPIGNDGQHSRRHRLRESDAEELLAGRAHHDVGPSEHIDVGSTVEFGVHLDAIGVTLGHGSECLGGVTDPFTGEQEAEVVPPRDESIDELEEDLGSLVVLPSVIPQDAWRARPFLAGGEISAVDADRDDTALVRNRLDEVGVAVIWEPAQQSG
jgi:hypothetical protein